MKALYNPKDAAQFRKNGQKQSPDKKPHTIQESQDTLTQRRVNVELVSATLAQR